MEPQRAPSFLCGPATGPYLEPYNSNWYASALFFKIHFNVILPPVPRCSKCPLPLRLFNQNWIILCVQYATPVSFSLFWLLQMWLVKSTNTKFFLYLLQPPVTSSPLGSNIPQSTLFSSILILHSTLSINGKYSWRPLIHQNGQFVV